MITTDPNKRLEQLKAEIIDKSLRILPQHFVWMVSHARDGVINTIKSVQDEMSRIAEFPGGYDLMRTSAALTIDQKRVQLQEALRQNYMILDFLNLVRDFVVQLNVVDFPNGIGDRLQAAVSALATPTSRPPEPEPDDYDPGADPRLAKNNDDLGRKNW